MKVKFIFYIFLYQRWHRCSNSCFLYSLDHCLLNTSLRLIGFFDKFLKLHSTLLCGLHQRLQLRLLISSELLSSIHLLSQHTSFRHSIFDLQSDLHGVIGYRLDFGCLDLHDVDLILDLCLAAFILGAQHQIVDDRHLSLVDVIDVSDVDRLWYVIVDVWPTASM